MPGSRIVVPLVEDRDQPVGVWGVPGSQSPSGRRRVPCPVRKQEVDAGRIEGRQRLVGGERVIPQVDRAQQAAEKALESAVAQPLKSGRDRSMAAPSRCEPSVSVVRLRVTIEADPDPDTEFTEQSQIGLVQANGVGLNAGSNANVGSSLLSRVGHEFPDEFVPGQQGLTAVKYQVTPRVRASARARRCVRACPATSPDIRLG